VSKRITINLTTALTQRDVEFPFEVEFDISSDLLPYPQSKVVGKAKFSGWYVYLDPEVDVFGTIYLTISGICDKCGEDVVESFEINFDQTFYKQAEEPDDYLYSCSRLYPYDAMQEEVMLSLPTSLLCNSHKDLDD